jgi:hypothetical protein
MVGRVADVALGERDLDVLEPLAAGADRRQRILPLAGRRRCRGHCRTCKSKGDRDAIFRYMRHALLLRMSQGDVSW